MSSLKGHQCDPITILCLAFNGFSLALAREKINDLSLELFASIYKRVAALINGQVNLYLAWLQIQKVPPLMKRTGREFLSAHPFFRATFYEGIGCFQDHHSQLFIPITMTGSAEQIKMGVSSI